MAGDLNRLAPGIHQLERVRDVDHGRGERDGARRWHTGRRQLDAWTCLFLLAIAFTSVLAVVGIGARPMDLSGVHSAVSRTGLQSHPVARLPLALEAAASPSLGAEGSAFRAQRHVGVLETEGGGIRTVFGTAGPVLRVAGGGTLSLSLATVGGAREGVVRPRVSGRSRNQVLYRHGSIAEFYRNGPYGLEAGLYHHEASSGRRARPLAIAEVGGLLKAAQAGSQVVFRSGLRTAMRYGQLAATDATGRRLPASTRIRNGFLEIRVVPAHARYPLRIDPFFQAEQLAPSGQVGDGLFGYSDAVSADGSTALVGAIEDDGRVGSAWVFVRSGPTWTQQGEKLTVSAEEPQFVGFGASVALSADGNTALVGGPDDDNGQTGAVWVFTRTGSVWTPQALLTGGEATEGASFGASVALSADGNTALVGGGGDDGQIGAAWVFARSGASWTQQGPKISRGEEACPCDFGVSVALSGDGDTALIGSQTYNGFVGTAWVYEHVGSSWSETEQLLGEGESGEAIFGSRVALSSDGDTALIGGQFDAVNLGAAWVFRRSGTKWAQQGEKLTGAGEVGSGYFGGSVGLSGDGNIAVVGGSGDSEYDGAAWVFTRSGSEWEQEGEKLTAAGEIGKGAFGENLAVSSNGAIALIGAPSNNAYVGGAWVFENTFAEPPRVITGQASSVTKTSATLNATVNPRGGAVSDCHFEYGTTVSYGASTPCSSLPGSGSEPVAVSAEASGLTPNTVYHARIVATNASGTRAGGDTQFRTLGPPDSGRCLKVAAEKVGGKTLYHGGFTTGACLVASPEQAGKYEWYPGVVASRFTTTLKSEKVTLETEDKTKVICHGESGAGEYRGVREVAKVVFGLSGCETTSGHPCTTPGLASGVIETKALEGTLGWEAVVTGEVALDLFPTSRSGAFLEYRCVGGVPVVVGGSVLVPVSTGKMSAAGTWVYKETKGIQKPEALEGEPADTLRASFNGEVLEGMGIAGSLSVSSEEAVEVNTAT